VNVFDFCIIVVGAAAALAGDRLGCVTRGRWGLGVGVGLLLASRLLPPVVRALRQRDAVPADLLLVAAFLLVVGAVLGQLLGLVAGGHLHLAIRSRTALSADRAAGAVAGVLGVLVAVWFLTPAMASVPGWSARAARNSAIAREVEHVFPGAPDTAQTLRRLIGGRYPEVFDALDPAPSLGNPPAATGIDAAMANQIASSTVEIEGQACDMVQAGTGFVVAPDLVVTNAHVVAGEHTINVIRTDGASFQATAVAFDPNRDLALLSVQSLDRPSLPLAEPSIGARGGVFGHPGGGPLTVAPFSIGRSESVMGNDIYDAKHIQRQVLFLAANLAPGDSGGPLVTPSGQVVGVAFAIAPDRPGVAYGLSTDDVRTLLQTEGGSAVSTGACAAG
jgi:S1-C subfamily serine protease